jgi:hypothetical protein
MTHGEPNGRIRRWVGLESATEQAPVLFSDHVPESTGRTAAERRLGETPELRP